MSPVLLVLLGVVGFLMVFGAGVAILVGGRDDMTERLEQFVGATDAEVIIPEDIRESRRDVADRMDQALEGRGFFDRIKRRIATAGVRLRVSEYVMLQLIAAFGLSVAAWFLFAPGVALFVAPIVFLLGLSLPRIWINIAATRRMRAFEGQLSDTLNLWVNAIRSGYSVLQGMEAIATELPPPVSREFERVVQEVRLGLSLERSLINMLRRLPSEDLELVVTAVTIQREVGGNLAEILDIISFTIRERVRIKREIRTLTAQGRLTGWIISLLPVVLAGVMYLINPEYGGQLLVQQDPFLFPGLPCGWLVLGIGAFMIFLGILAVRRIVDIEV